MHEITLNEILAAREQRVKKQKELITRFKCPVVSFSMNIAGPVKVSPLIERSFFEGIKLIKEKFSYDLIIYESKEVNPTGCEAYFSVNENAHKIKEITTLIEESSELGRLFDIDVIDTDFLKIERKSKRACLICKKVGMECSARRIHPVSELWEETEKIMQEYFYNHDKKFISSLCVKSLINEVHTTPKPGLVDLNNNGSHLDMNVETFEKSANSLKGYFENCFKLGVDNNNLSYDKLFKLLKVQGIKAEETMYKVTRGINTHKGAIYSLGLICAGMGRLWTPYYPFKPTYNILKEVSDIVKNSIENEFKDIGLSTEGGRLFKEYGIKGARGEAASGFQSVLKISLPVYKKLRSENYSLNDAGAITLIYLISQICDTNLYKRGKKEGFEYAKNLAKGLLSRSPYPKKEEIELLDKEFIRLNLSPGGAADLLSLTYLLYETEIANNNTHCHTD